MYCVLLFISCMMCDVHAIFLSEFASMMKHSKINFEFVLSKLVQTCFSAHRCPLLCLPAPSAPKFPTLYRV